jgi:hypothetical protein
LTQTRLFDLMYHLTQAFLANLFLTYHLNQFHLFVLMYHLIPPHLFVLTYHLNQFHLFVLKFLNYLIVLVHLQDLFANY